MNHKLDLSNKIEVLPTSNGRSAIIKASAKFLHQRGLRLYRVKTHKSSWLVESPKGQQWLYANVDHLVRSLVDFYESYKDNEATV